MKKATLMFFALIVLAGFISTAEAEYSLITVIRTYGPGEYAVKGLVEEQAQAFIKPWTKKPTRFLIEGSADKTGDVARNDEYGSKRANEMKAYLKKKFPNIPDADFIVRSLGDQLNARQVQISVEFEAEVLPKAKDELPNKVSLKFVIWLVVGLASAAYLLYLLIRRPRTKKGEKKAEEPMRERWITGRAWDGLEYSVQVMQKKTGECVAPFFKKGSMDFEERDNFQAMKKCVHIWVKDPNNATDFSWLMNKRIIVIGRREESL